MFKSSFSKLPPKPVKDADFPLITALNFGELAPQKEIETAPVLCSVCGSILTDPTELQQTNTGYIYTCPFCMAQNEITQEQGESLLGVIPREDETAPTEGVSAQDLCYLLDQIRDKDKDKDELLKSLEMKKQDTAIPVQVAIIDQSGSMQGGKVEAVKHALVQAIHELTAEHPKTNFILIPFSMDVYVYPIPSIKVEMNDGPHFFSEDQMRQEVSEIIKKTPFQPVEKLYKDWTKIVKKIETLDTTALGPALFIGIQMIAESQKTNKVKAGGKVLLLTDGLANVGIGSIENNPPPDDKNRVFYHHLGEICLQNNIIVDIIAVRDSDGGNSVALDIIGKVTDYTGGQMIFITADQIEKAFGTLQSTNYVARNVVMKVFAPDFLKVDEIQGAELLDKLSTKNGTPIHLGALYSDREIYLKFKASGSKLVEGTKVPIQVQLDYLDANNAHHLRCYQQQVEISGNTEDFKAQFNAKVATAYELSKASNLSKVGNISGARIQAQQTMARNSMLSKQYKINVDEMNQVVESEMDDLTNLEKEAENQKIADKSSYYQSTNQGSSRGSYNMKLKKAQKKM